MYTHIYIQTNDKKECWSLLERSQEYAIHTFFFFWLGKRALFHRKKVISEKGNMQKLFSFAGSHSPMSYTPLQTHESERGSMTNGELFLILVRTHTHGDASLLVRKGRERDDDDDETWQNVNMYTQSSERASERKREKRNSIELSVNETHQRSVGA
jgi:hypothetical protein